MLTARGSEMEREFGFGVVRQLLGPLLRTLDADARAGLFAGPAGLAEPIFGLGGEGLDAGGAESSLYGLFWLVAGLAEDRPLVLAIDDAHWADAASLRFARYLARRLTGMPVLLVLTARPDEPGVQTELVRGLAAEPGVPTLRPEPLSEAGTAALVARAARRRRPGAVRARLPRGDRRQPVPDRGAPRRADRGGGRRRAPAGPDRVDGAAADRRRGRRAGRRDRSARRRTLTRAAAVLGDATDLTALAALTGAERERGGDDRRPPRRRLDPRPGPGLRLRPPAGAPGRLRGDPRRPPRRAARPGGGGAGGAGGRSGGGRRPPPALRAGRRSRAGSTRSSGPPTRRSGAAPRRARSPTCAGPCSSRVRGGAELLATLGSLEVVVRDPQSIAHLEEAAELTADPATAIGIYLELADLLSLAGQWEACVQTVDSGLARFADQDVPGVLDLEAFRAAYRGYDPARTADFDRDLPRLRALVEASTPDATRGGCAGCSPGSARSARPRGPRSNASATAASRTGACARTGARSRPSPRRRWRCWSSKPSTTSRRSARSWSRTGGGAAPCWRRWRGSASAPPWPRAAVACATPRPTSRRWSR